MVWKKHVSADYLCETCPKEATGCPAAAQSGRYGGGWDVQTPLSFRAPR